MASNTRYAKAVIMMMECMCIVMAAGGVASAAQYKVGDADGWTIKSVNYTTWAASNEFHVGDSLLFEYNKDWHNVLEVKKADYDSCKNSTPIATYESGNDTLKLSNKGFHYYLCGIIGHCELGQKLEINVLAAYNSSPASSPSPSPSPTAKKPESGSSTSPSPSPKTAAKSGGAPSASQIASKNNAPDKHGGFFLLALIWGLGSVLFYI